MLNVCVPQSLNVAHHLKKNVIKKLSFKDSSTEIVTKLCDRKTIFQAISQTFDLFVFLLQLGYLEIMWGHMTW